MIEEKEELEKIGKKLERLRIAKGYKSYEDFAITNNLSRMQYWRIEKGKTNITIRSLINILNIHGITLDELFSMENKSI